MTEEAKNKTIVFIHGLYMNPGSWDSWIDFFQKKGYSCHAPAYPYHQGKPEVLRKNIDPELGKVTFGDVLARLLEFIDELPEKPVLIGHSMGGLLVQKLIEMEKGQAGICIAPAPPTGVFSFKWSFFKVNLPVVNPLKGDSVSLPDIKWFHYAFCNTMSMEQTRIEYDRHFVPESRNIPRSSTKSEGKIDFSKPHKPLLFISGEKDHIIPASLNRKIFNSYKDKNSIRELKLFKGRCHLTCRQEGWEGVALYCSEWLAKL